MYSRHHAALLFAPLLVFAGSSLAGPVQESEVDSRTASADHASAALPPLSGRSLEQGAASNLVASPMTPVILGDAASAPSTSALAAEIIKEVESGVQATSEQTRGAKAQALGQAIASGPSDDSGTRSTDDEWSLRKLGKAAVHWIKETVPWLRSDADQGGTGHSAALAGADWSTSPLDGRATDRNPRGNTTQLPDALRDVSLDPTPTGRFGKNMAPPVLEPEQNLVSTVFSVVGEVVEHPMTWLVVCLFVIGGAVVKKIDRRPMK